MNKIKRADVKSSVNPQLFATHHRRLKLRINFTTIILEMLALRTEQTQSKLEIEYR